MAAEFSHSLSLQRTRLRRD